MSSEGAYLPGALAGLPNGRGQSRSAPEARQELLEEALSPIDITARAPASVIEISEVTEERLLEQVRDGDKEALGILFRRYARSVRNVAYRILRNEAEADDLVQEVFLFIFRKAESFDSSHWAARSW